MAGYYFVGIIAFAASMLVQWWLRNTYNTWMKRANASGLTGREVARAILEANGVNDVKVEMVKGTLTDHYDPTSKTVRLSEGNFGHANVAGMAVAAHEVGHALQHNLGYTPLQWRTSLLPVASIGSQWGPILAMVGLFLTGGPSILLTIGIWLFAGAVLFHLVTLPIEFDASRRALVQLDRLGIVTSQDAGGARSVLTAAAMTYVAAAATAITYLIYFIMASRR
ncbi:MAG: zinc metallopeptidase [Trueperaceae bacterium]